jgi:hypothetical protein
MVCSAEQTIADYILVKECYQLRENNKSMKKNMILKNKEFKTEIINEEFQNLELSPRPSLIIIQKSAVLIVNKTDRN